MRYWFKLSEDYQLTIDILNGDKPTKVTLYEEKDEIISDFENNPNSDWWAVWRHGDFSTEPGDYNSIEEAKEDYYANVSERVYCISHDC